MLVASSLELSEIVGLHDFVKTVFPQTKGGTTVGGFLLTFYRITSIDQDDVMSRIMHLNQSYTLSLKALQKNFEMIDKVLEILR